MQAAGPSLSAVACCCICYRDVKAEIQLSRRLCAYTDHMKDIMCRILGHQEYDPGVVAAHPWDDPDFYEYDLEDFRETNCVRCGHLLEHRRNSDRAAA